MYKRQLYTFEVRDTGIGMSPEFVAHMFEPFSQEDNGIRTKYKGTGLGLSIVKSLVEKLHGYIQVESTPGKMCIRNRQMTVMDMCLATR